MADTQSNIKVSIDTTDALTSIKNLQRQISAFHTSMAKSGAAANAVTAGMQQTLINSINATGKFSAQMRTIKTTTESFTNSLEKNKFSLGEYFRYAGGASKSFGKLFKSEFETINKVARENVKDLQTQYIKMGRDANGSMKAIAVRPLMLDMNDLATKTMIASEKQALLNQLLKQGSTNLLNFGKNTQWAGRQLMVGFTIPLITVGSQAAKTFMDMETQAIRFKKVYGDIFTPQAESVAALDSIKNLGKEFTKYGVAVSATVGLAADAAAAGYKGVDLQNQTTAATRLSILGQIDNQQALETTIALQNAFGTSSAELAGTIDFLNAVENQTVLSLDDVTTAIPKAAPVVKQLGGDVKDLAFFLTAMKQGGINASEGANALKSGLASMINPTKKAKEMLSGLGIDITGIVEKDRGNLKKTVIDFATALNQLDPLNRAQAIEQMFGKFQFARISTLMQNVTAQGTQAAKVLDLAGASMQDLAGLSEKELGITADSAMNKFKASIENLKLSLVPVGEEFLKAVTPIAQFVSDILDKFNNLGSGTKKVIVMLTTIVAGLGPVLLMTFGLLANGIANIIKGFTAVKTLFNRTGESSATLGTEVKYMTLEQRNAAAVAASLDQVHKNLAQTFTAEAAAVDALTNAYARAITKQSQFIPTSPVIGRGPIKKRAKGKPITVGGTGNQDSELSLLTPGETVIPRDMSKKYAGLINGMIANNIPGYAKGKGMVTGSVFGYSGAFSRKSSISSIEATFNALEEGVQQEVAAAIPDIMSSLEGTSISLTKFGDEIKKRIDEGTLSIRKSQIGGFGEDITSSAPTALAKRKAKMTPWDTRQAELAAKEKLAAEYALTETQKAEVGLTSSTSEMRGTSIAHLQPKEAGKAKDWSVRTQEGMARLQAEDTAINAYLNDLSGITEEYKGKTTEFIKSVTTATEQQSGIAQRLLAGEQPKTKREYDILAQVAERDLATRGTSESITGGKKKSLYRAAFAGSASKIRTGSKTYFDNAGGINPEYQNFDPKESAATAAAQGKKDAEAYNKSVSKQTSDKNDKYVKNRSKKRSAHQKASKDGKDDAVAYNKSVDQETKKANSRRASRKQGPAGIGPIIPAGTKELSIVPQLTAAEKRRDARQQTKTKLLGGMKTAGSKLGTRLGGGTALLGANMALSAMPDFAGKGMIQATMSGANMGMLFGPWGAAAGAAIGLVSSALGTLIAKEKEQKAVAEATFKGSADVAKFFGTEAANALTPISNFAIGFDKIAKSGKDAEQSIGLSAKEVSNFKQMVESLPTDNPLATIVRGVASESDPAKIKELASSFVTMQVALGQIKPDDSQKLLDLILTASGKSGLVGNMTINIKNQAEAIKQSIRSAASSFDTLKTAIGQTVTAASSAGSIKELQTYIDAIATSGYNGANGINALRESFLALGNVTASKTVSALSTMGLKVNEIATVIAAINKGFSFDVKGKTGKDVLSAAQQYNIKAFSAKSTNNAAGTKPYQAQNDTLTGQNKILDQQIKALEKKKKLIDDQIAAQKKVTDELKKQHDFEVSQAELESKIVDAKIRGNYIEAANLKQQQANKAMEYKQEGALTPLEDKSAALQAQIDALKEKKDSNSTAINNNTAAIDNLTSTINSTDFSPSPGGLTGVNTGTSKNPYTTSSTKQAGENVPEVKGSVKKGQFGLDPSQWNNPLFNLAGQSQREKIKKYAEAEGYTAGEYFTVNHNNIAYKFKVRDDGNITMVSQTPIKVKAKGTIPKLPGMSSGGLIKGPGTGISDSITATLGYAGGGNIRVSNGEFIMKEAAVQNYGISQMNAINNGTAKLGADAGGTVYNINMPITSNNASASGVADEVMRRLKVELNKNNKSNRINI